MGGFSQGKVRKNLGTRQLCLGQILLWLTDSGFFFFYYLFSCVSSCAKKCHKCHSGIPLCLPFGSLSAADGIDGGMCFLFWEGRRCGLRWRGSGRGRWRPRGVGGATGGWEPRAACQLRRAARRGGCVYVCVRICGVRWVSGWVFVLGHSRDREGHWRQGARESEGEPITDWASENGESEVSDPDHVDVLVFFF